MNIDPYYSCFLKMCWEKVKSCLCEAHCSEGEMQDGRKMLVVYTAVFPVFYYGI